MGTRRGHSRPRRKPSSPPAQRRKTGTPTPHPHRDEGAIARICRWHGPRGPWQNSPAPWVWRRRNPAAGTGSRSRNCPHLPSKIYGNLRKNPVNLSIFIEFFGNSIFSNKPIGFTIIRESPESARTAIAGNCEGGLRWKTKPDSPERGHRKASQPLRLLPNASLPVTANAGKCALVSTRGEVCRHDFRRDARGGK